ncbi:hypothetical protein HZC07_04175 [Candidatus Micrarchaeota archaeon]|nr:hypothetical protein [Candidatus Micrarchaeota archaeon]
MYEKLLSKYGYAEIRMEQDSNTSISIMDGEIRTVFGKTTGISARVLQNGSWGFSSESIVAENKIEKKEIRSKLKESGLEEKTRRLVEIEEEMKIRKIASQTLSCTDSATKKEFYNSEGSEIIQNIGYTYLS